jgi:hypothetical protein
MAKLLECALKTIVHKTLETIEVSNDPPAILAWQCAERRRTKTLALKPGTSINARTLRWLKRAVHNRKISSVLALEAGILAGRLVSRDSACRPRAVSAPANRREIGLITLRFP